MAELLQQKSLKSGESANSTKEDGEDSASELVTGAVGEDKQCLLEQQPVEKSHLYFIFKQIIFFLFQDVVTRKGIRSRSFRRICCLVVLGLAVIFILSLILEITITLSFVLKNNNGTTLSLLLMG